MSEKLISIIVPVYNVNQYLDRCVESLINQTYKNIEIVLVDDGSTDESGKLCDKWAEKDKRIVVVHKKNGGLSDARNVGIDVSTGEYIGFVDGDDYIETNMYEILNKYVDDVDFVTCGITDEYCDGYKIINCSGENECEVLTPEEAIIFFLDEVNGGNVSSCCKLWRKSLFSLEKYSVGKTYEDLDIIWRLLKRKQRVSQVNLPLYHYCHREGSITTKSIDSSFFDLIEYADKILEDVKHDYYELRRYACVYWVNKYIYVLSRLYSDGDENYKERIYQLENNIKNNRRLILQSPVHWWSKVVAIGASFHKGSEIIILLSKVGSLLRKNRR